MDRTSLIKNAIKGSIKLYKNESTHVRIFNQILTDYYFGLLIENFQNEINGKDFSTINKIERYSNKNISFDIISKKIKINIKFKFKKFIDLFFYILVIPTSFFKFKSRRNLKEICIFYSLTKDQIAINNEDFTDYFEYFKKKYKKEKYSNVFVVGKFGTFKNSNYISVLNPGIKLFCKLDTKQKFNILKKIKPELNHTIKSLFFYRESILILKKYLDDLLVISVSNLLNIDLLIVVTQTNLISCPPILYLDSVKKIEKIALWYSDNNQAIYKLGSNKKFFEYSFWQLDLVDCHFVWSNTWANIIKKLSKSNVFVEGPIIFQDLEEYTSKELKYIRNPKQIAFFDVLSHNKNNELFYSEKVIVDILSGLVGAVKKCNKTDIELLIKHKRNYNMRQGAYLNTVNNFLNSNDITVVKSKVNIIELILSSSLVICTPRTSVALLSKSLNTPSIYYCPPNDFYLENEYEGVPIIRLESDLISVINQYIV